MAMKLTVLVNREGKQWKDPLIKYLEDHVFWIALEMGDDFIQDMATLFCYLVDLQGEFLTCNKQYTRPLNFSIEFRRNDRGERILLGYHEESITLLSA
jgi:hypothetical protein